MSNLADDFLAAIEHHQAGRLSQAEQSYRAILARDPGHAQAWHHLGVLASQVGKYEPAAECIRKAIALQPNDPVFYRHLGLCYSYLHRQDEAVSAHQKALELRPDFFEARGDLARFLFDRSRFAEAQAHYEMLVERRPDDAELRNSLGNTFAAQKRLAEAQACYEQAISLNPIYPEAHNNLGNVLQDQGRFAEALPHYRRALELRPGYTKARVNLGLSYAEEGRVQEAYTCLMQALQEMPDNLDALNTLGNVYKELGNLKEAETCFRRVLQLDSRFAFAHNNLGNVLKDEGEVVEAVACFRRAVALKPDFVEAHSNLIFTLLYCPDIRETEIAAELERWNYLHADPLHAVITPHDNDPAPERRLRIGYVSPDLYNHVVGRFLLPVFERHDPAQCELYCYASVRSADAFTERFRQRADVWRPCLGLSDELLAQRIRADRIDLLVDLSLHTAGNRLLTFARKPAPVQVTYLAYCGTSGMKAMDYRLTDAHLDPPGQEWQTAETPLRLPETYWCYRPVLDAGEPAAKTIRRPGAVTFGCLNNFCKVNDATLALWARLLQRLPEARLLLHAQAGRPRERVYQAFAEHGIDHERVEFCASVPLADYFQLYDRIDIALDPFPYGGGTTTCDALWMGVPVVSLAGPRAMGRGGLSILSNVGLTSMVADNEEVYLHLAIDLAQSPAQLNELHTSLRAKMQNSPLMDPERFARHLEAAYRSVWKKWCNATHP
jgi:protein O-GlcNAc transferase